MGWNSGNSWGENWVVKLTNDDIVAEIEIS